MLKRLHLLRVHLGGRSADAERSGSLPGRHRAIDVLTDAAAERRQFVDVKRREHQRFRVENADRRADALVRRDNRNGREAAHGVLTLEEQLREHRMVFDVWNDERIRRLGDLSEKAEVGRVADGDGRPRVAGGDVERQVFVVVDAQIPDARRHLKPSSRFNRGAIDDVVEVRGGRFRRGSGAPHLAGSSHRSRFGEQYVRQSRVVDVQRENRRNFQRSVSARVLPTATTRARPRR